MSFKNRKRYTDEQKKKAIDDYVSGRKTVQEISAEMSVDLNAVYRWRAQLDAKTKGLEASELEAQGLSPDAIKRIQELEDKIEAYEKTVAHQALIIDLLKKLPTSTSYQPESELTGLISTTKRLGRFKKPVG